MRIPAYAAPVVAAAAGLLILACADKGTPTGPGDTTSEAYRTVVEVGDANTVDPHFFFLPPIVATDPTYAGVFDATLSPLVRICEGTDPDCTHLVAEFTMEAAPGREKVRLAEEEEETGSANRAPPPPPTGGGSPPRRWSCLTEPTLPPAMACS